MNFKKYYQNQFEFEKFCKVYNENNLISRLILPFVIAMKDLENFLWKNEKVDLLFNTGQRGQNDMLGSWGAGELGAGGWGLGRLHKKIKSPLFSNLLPTEK